MTGARDGEFDAAARQRRQRRDWIRSHHPDAGGDPVVFAQGLARLERSGSTEGPAERITIVHSRGPLVRARRLVRHVIRRQPPRQLL